MGKNLAKKISGLNKVPHPKGRKTAQLTRQTLRAAGKDKIKLLSLMKQNLLGEKLMWFKENLNLVDKYTPELTIDLIERYLGRFDEELNQIEIKHCTGKRKGRQHANREDVIRMTLKNERNEFLTCGIEVPDVLNSKQLNLLRNWSGELRYLHNFKLARYSKRKLLSLMSSVKNSGAEKDRAEEFSSGKNDSIEKLSEELEEDISSMKMELDS